MQQLLSFAAPMLLSVSQSRKVLSSPCAAATLTDNSIVSLPALDTFSTASVILAGSQPGLSNVLLDTFCASDSERGVVRIDPLPFLIGCLATTERPALDGWTYLTDCGHGIKDGLYYCPAHAAALEAILREGGLDDPENDTPP